VTPPGLRKFDGLRAEEAVVRAWADPGDRGGWHERARDEVRETMPLLARALDRMARQAGVGP
jgi:hypothetical protein